MELGFLNKIRDSFGNSTVLIFKEHMKINSKLSSYSSRKSFLVKCRRFGLYPTHIIKNLKCLFNNLEPNMPLNNKIQKIEEDFKRRILNVEIEITYWKISSLNKTLIALKNQLQSTNVPVIILEEFFKTQSRIYHNLLKPKLKNVSKKFDSLKYYQYSKFNLSNNNWCCNISETYIPQNIVETIALGPKFALPYINIKEIPTYKILTDTESIIQNIKDQHDQDIARFQISNAIYSFLNHKFNTTAKDKFIYNSFLDAKNFLKQNSNIIVLKSDKGNKSVIMNRADYKEKIYSLISDQNNYKILDRDPTLSLQTKNNDHIKTLFNLKYINYETKKQLTSYNSISPKLYGLPKVHKNNFPLRPIVSFINAPTYKTSKYLANTLKHMTNNKYNIQNSYDFIDFIKSINIPDNYILISLDVVSLFTNIKIDLAINLIDTKFEKIRPHIDIPKANFLNILSFCLKSGYFSFNNEFYKQIDGIAMGSPISPIIANIVMENLLDNILKSINFNIHFVKLYVDDLLLCIPKDKLSEILSIFNNNLFGLEFTLETEKDYKIAFLDTLLTRQSNGKIISVWYNKSCSSGRILNYHSSHPINQIINTAYGFIYRVMKLTTDEKFDTKSLIFRYLLENKFPKSLIFKLLSRYNNNLITSSTNLNITNTLFVPFQSIVYVKGLSEILSNILKKFDISSRITFSVSNTLNKIFTRLKDKTPKLHHFNVIYKIPCLGCNLIYIGTTGQLLKNRISCHKSDVKPPIKNHLKTSLCQHTHDTGHNFGFNNIEILNVENKYNKRLFLEMAYINAYNKLTVNKKSDTHELSSIYSGLIDFISKI